jgi:hypothetical protein
MEGRRVYQKNSQKLYYETSFYKTKPQQASLGHNFDGFSCNIYWLILKKKFFFKHPGRAQKSEQAISADRIIKFEKLAYGN